MQFSFIVPLYNCLSLTQAMLASLQATLPPGVSHEIIFVDDGSTDGTRGWLEGLPPPCRAILNEHNLGFAATCNRGADAASGEFLVLLNNDLVLLPGWLQPMLAGFEHDRTLGVVGNLQVRVDNGDLDHAGLMVTPAGKIAHVRIPPRGSGVVEVPGVTAACLMIRRAVFQSAGCFDAEFRNGGEDVDLCFRLRARGLKCGVATASVVRHHVSAARGPTNERDERNSRRLVGRWPEELIYWGARTWASEQVGHFLHRPWTREGWRALRALPFAHGWTRRPPEFARLLLTSALHREKIRWSRLFDQPADAPRAPRGAPLYHEERFFRDEVDLRSTWLRDHATIRLPDGFPASNFFVSGFLLPVPPDRPEARRPIGFRLILNGRQVAEFPDLPEGNFNCGIDAPFILPDEPTRVDIELLGVRRTNFYAWAGRMVERLPIAAAWRRRLIRFRYQALNRRLRFARIVGDDEVLFDFKRQPALHRLLREPTGVTGVNLIGWFRAALGIGESVRCMAKACEAAALPAALVELRLNCLNPHGDDTYATRLQEAHPHPINIFHLDPPVSDQVDHHHGPELRRDRYNIGYWAWELPEFPDEWVRHAAYFDEIWCPSEFVRASIRTKVDLPVLVMPHAIEFSPPAGDGRARFSLPADRFLFLFAYDLNSYQERKNPLAVVAAYRRAFPDEAGVALVIKTQNPGRNAVAFAELCDALRGLRQVTLITETLTRPEVYLLEQSCDAFVSLHRAEGFGLAVAECMSLGKPVVSTDWSATAEYLNESNGCPVRYKLTELRESHGPYRAGQKWAEPDPVHAAEWMRRLVEESGLAARLGSAARETIRTRFSPAAVGARYRQRLAALFPNPPAG